LFYRKPGTESGTHSLTYGVNVRQNRRYSIAISGEMKNDDLYRLCDRFHHINDIDVLVFQVVEQGLNDGCIAVRFCGVLITYRGL